MNVIEQLTNEQIRKDLPQLNIGDTVKVHVKVREGSRERVQIFEGTIIAKKNGGISQTFTVRRLSYGVGVERTFLVNSPNIVKIEIVRSGKVRRAKLYYLRDRIGKSAKVKEKIRGAGVSAAPAKVEKVVETEAPAAEPEVTAETTEETTE